MGGMDGRKEGGGGMGGQLVRFEGLNWASEWCGPASGCKGQERPGKAQCRLLWLGTFLEPEGGKMKQDGWT